MSPIFRGMMRTSVVNFYELSRKTGKTMRKQNAKTGADPVDISSFVW